MKLPHGARQYIRRIVEPQRTIRMLRVTDAMAVIVILGVVGALVGPQLSTASQDPRRMALQQDLDYLRRQIALYRVQHHGAAPDADRFVKQLTEFTDEKGNVSARRSERFRYGPYVTEMPVHPRTGLAPVSAGWVYDPDTGELMPDPDGP